MLLSGQRCRSMFLLLCNFRKETISLQGLLKFHVVVSRRGGSERKKLIRCMFMSDRLTPPAWKILANILNVSEHDTSRSGYNIRRRRPVRPTHSGTQHRAANVSGEANTANCSNFTSHMTRPSGPLPLSAVWVGYARVKWPELHLSLLQLASVSIS